MKDPFFVGAIVHSPEKKIMLRVTYVYPNNPDTIRVALLNHSVSFDVPAIEWDIIDPLQYFEYYRLTPSAI